MANKSPGVYITTNDNTEYYNTASYNGTTCAIVGYASKGPVGVPTYVSSLNKYVQLFGGGVRGYYSFMAAKNVFAAGGTVLFTRVADETVSPSSTVIKNGVEFKRGFTYFGNNRTVTIGNDGLETRKLYAAKVEGKTVYVSVGNNSITQSNIFNQINNQLSVDNAAKAFIPVIGSNTESTKGVFGFNLKVNGEKIYNNDMYISVTQRCSADLLANKITKAINRGSNAFIDINTNVSYNSLDTTETIYDVLTNEGANLEEYEDKLDEVKTLKFVITTSTGSVSKGVDVTLNDTYGEFFDKIVTAFESDGKYKVIVSNKEGKVSLKVISMNNDIYFDIGFFSEDGTVDSELFVAKTEDGTPELSYAADPTPYSIIVDTIDQTAAELQVAEVIKSVEFDSELNCIVIETLEEGVVEGAPVSVEVLPPALESLNLFGAVSGVVDPYRKVFSIAGREAIENVDVSIETYEGGKRIKFVYSENKIECPEIKEATLETENYTFGDLLSIEGTAIKEEGNTSIASDEKDIVVISTKEEGSASNNITVEIKTTTSPLDYTSTTNLFVYENGLPRETFEDINLNYSAGEERIDVILNKEPENGGSAYINMYVEKNDADNEKIQLNDGVYKIGKANTSEDVAYGASMDIENYAAYDYSVGTDGIPENGDGLFMEALDPEDSPLSNTEIYKYSILITPDNISSDVQDVAIALCDKNETALYIVDPPYGLERDEVINWHNGKHSERTSAITSKQAAIYSPWIKTFNSAKGTYDWVMPSVVMAGKWIQVDESVGTQYAPAGEVNGQLSATDVASIYTVKDRDLMYVDYNRINPIIKYNNGNVLIWGEKTAQRKNSTLTKIHTVRMVSKIRQRLEVALRSYIFLPTIERNISDVRTIVTSIMEQYKTGGGISSYKVKCDSSNNPTDSLQQDILYVDVSCVPVGCIEQVEISLTLNKTDNE